MTEQNARLHLEMRHLRTLLAIRDTGSIASAAKRLHLTQSALSHQLKGLENELGTPILARHKRRSIRFTAAGQRLLQLADDILPRIEAAERDIHDLAAGDRGRLHISIECHSCFDWLLPAMDRYREAWPQIELDLSLAYSLDPLPALLDGVIDMVITSDPMSHAGVSYSALFRYQSVLVMANDHPLGERDHIEPADLVNETLLTYPVARQRLDVFRHFLEPAGVEVAAIRTAELTSMIVQLVASRRGVAVLPSWAIEKYRADDYIRTRPLGGDGMWSTLYSAVRREQASLPFVQAFTELARDLTHAQLDGIKPATVEE
ncbi:LysR family transcriptional regulator for metE and metH [Methylohalomonas lacus]|uniref:HTH-type transcriptional regulator MetR n=1 Tax=Methylohalomonas lacus TaxID=398773 RepID=A0AAE3HLK2_9GAMM|nr:LysR family transcriptional regulator [Methylohalomonas lacus]MCS3902668.1 LysR family transcriptional regulator for metE and metH [Methylohalomonas lacus]